MLIDTKAICYSQNLFYKSKRFDVPNHLQQSLKLHSSVFDSFILVTMDFFCKECLFFYYESPGRQIIGYPVKCNAHLVRKPYFYTCFICPRLKLFRLSGSKPNLQFFNFLNQLLCRLLPV